MIYNVIIIGSGPAGLTAAIYLSRAGLAPFIITGNLPGGNLVNTSYVENYPGFNRPILGSDLMVNMIQQAETCGTKFEYSEVHEIIKLKNGMFEINCNNTSFISKAILVATGTTHNKLNIPGEDKFTNKGVSWCAVCDGALYKNKTVAIVGGGNSAVTAANFLSKLSKKTYLIHRRNELKADKAEQKKLTNIELIFNSEVIEICGEQSVNSITLYNKQSKQKSNICIDGIFIYIGTKPNSKLVKDIVELDSNGYILAKYTQTSMSGIFAAGDVVSNSLRQAVFAAGQGALAAIRIEEFLNKY